MCLDCLLLGWDTILNAILDQTYPTMGDGEKIVALTFRYKALALAHIQGVPIKLALLALSKNELVFCR